jgi:adenine-specific DNA-methyltransferase
MARKRKESTEENVGDYRHDEARRKNNPPAGIAPTYEARERLVTSYAYDPHLDPQLQWAGKAEHTSFEVDLVSLHIHERISTRAILEAVKKPEPQLSLFGETILPMNQQIEFYQHEVGWANRLILGDSLLVMNSLLVKEGMAGKVQMIYIDPPYGIKYSSNFQPRVDRRDVKDKDEDLTHEPEQIKAYRDTWKLGIHSYLTYLRDRLLLSRELLAESGSIFIQINDENLHLVRSLLDEVFKRENFIGLLAFQKTAARAAKLIDTTNDSLLWYSKNKDTIKYNQLYLLKNELPVAEQYNLWELPDGSIQRSSKNKAVPPEAKRLMADQLLSPGATPSGTFSFSLGDRTFHPASGYHWKTTQEGLQRLLQANRLITVGSWLKYKRHLIDFPVVPVTNIWMDTVPSTFSEEDQKIYAVQTATKVIERCILMTTDPGDLVFDPTCGSGTTAYCAEKWGRRWITCDTSRVALAIARQRLMTGKYDYYELRDSTRGPAGGFIYESVSHITLESIAHNTEIDTIAAKYQPQIDEALSDLNKALGNKWKEWEIPREAEPKWSKKAKDAHELFGSLKRKKRQEIDESIQRYASQETLYDRPQIRRGVVRVSGPYSVEAIPVPAIEDPSQIPIPQFEQEEVQTRISDRGGDYLTTMLNLLKQQGGVLFPGGKKMELQNLRLLNVGMLHAEAEAKQNGKRGRVALSFGPQYGPVTAIQVNEAIQTAKLNAYDLLIIAGFSFEAEAQAFVQKAHDLVRGLGIHFANIAPDVLVGDLLKTTRASQIFTVFGQPDVHLEKQKDGTLAVELRGVDIYDPLTGETQHARGADVAAWFLDTDYDGMTFHICQSFFPGDPDAWDKLQRALRAQIELDVFEQMRGTRSFPFKPGDHKRIAVKVIDFRGNEVVRIIPLEPVSYKKDKK